MKTGQTWPYRKDRDDCNDRVTPNSPKDSNPCFPNNQALEPCHNQGYTHHLVRGPTGSGAWISGHNSPVTIFSKIDIFSHIKRDTCSWKERETGKF